MIRLRASSHAVISAGCAGAAAGAGLAAMLAAQDGSLRPSRLVNISASDPLATLAKGADPHFAFVTPAQHYDGAYYYAIARDPLLTGRAHTLIDQPAYRYGHPLHGWLAWALSLGRGGQVPLALLLLSLIGLAIAGWTVSRLAVRHGRTPYAGLVIAMSPGLLFAATVSTTETVGAALIALTFLAWGQQRNGWAALLLVAVCLDKEQYVTVPLGLAVWEIVQARRVGVPQRWLAKLLAIGSGPVALTGWYLYVHARLNTWPWDYQPGNLGRPLSGWRETIRLAHVLAGGSFEQSQIGSVSPAVLVVVAVVLIVATMRALAVRTVFDVPLIGMAIIVAMQGWRTLLYPHELVRTPAIALLLAVGVLTARHPGGGSRSVESAQPGRRVEE